VTSRVRDFYRLVDLGDVPGLSALFTDDCAYHRPGYPPILGRHAMSHFYTHERVIREGTHELDVVVVDGNEAAVRGSFQGVLRDGSPVSHRFAEFFTLAADGRFRGRETFFFTAHV
jgi:ketosteroid isomerase-like protein